MSDRGRRRNDLKRMKRRSVRLYGTPKLANHLHPCSCYGCCGNRRVIDGETFDERLHSIRQQLKDFGDC